IVIGPPGDDGEGLRDVLADLARAELIRPCYWLVPQDVTTGLVAADRLDADGSTTVTLPDDLAPVAWDWCCLLLAQLVAPDLEPDPGAVSFARDYAGFLARTVLTTATPVVPVNLVVPASDPGNPGGHGDAGGGGTGLLVPGWERTL